jgi:choline dehydrogenase-like flavoprotein
MRDAASEFEIVIVGGGPAGLAAACVAAESGCHVGLVETAHWLGVENIPATWERRRPREILRCQLMKSPARTRRSQVTLGTGLSGSAVRVQLLLIALRLLPPRARVCYWRSTRMNRRKFTGNV